MSVSDKNGDYNGVFVSFGGDSSKDLLEKNMPEHSSPEVRAAREAFRKLGQAAESDECTQEHTDDFEEEPCDQKKRGLSGHRFNKGLGAGATLGLAVGAFGFLISIPVGLVGMAALGLGGAALGGRVIST
jgi:hypothetical protein